MLCDDITTVPRDRIGVSRQTRHRHEVVLCLTRVSQSVST